eukprot:10746752-Ditylum_brightwellii.AAC.1
MTNPNATKTKHEAVSPANSLCWDNNNKDFEEALEMEEDTKKNGGTDWKRAGDEKGQKGANM